MRHTRSAKLLAMLLAVMTVFSANLPAASVLADVFYDTGLTEYVFYDSFEDAELGLNKLPSGWTLYASDYEIVEDEKSDGERSVLIHDPSDAQGAGLRTKHIPVTPGQAYKTEVACRTVKGGSQIYMEFWNASGIRLTPVAIFSTTSFRWKDFSCTAVAPEGAVTMTVLLYLVGGNIGDTYYDNIRVTKTDEGTVPGSEFEDKEYTPIVKGYPRLYFTADEKQAFIDKAKNTKPNYSGASSADVSATIIKSANTYLTETKFSCSYYNGYKVEYSVPLEMPEYRENPPEYLAGGRYPYWTALGGQIRTRLQYLSAAYVLTGEEKYARRAVDWCLWLCDWKSWTDPTFGNGSGCLDSGYITYGVCTAYDLLYDYMTEKERETIKENIYQKSLKLHLSSWNTTTDHNIQMVQTAALGTAGALLLGEYPEAVEAINRAVEYFNVYLDKRLYTGDHEGNMYTSLSLEYMMVAVDHIWRVTGDPTVMEHEYLSEFLFKWMIAGGDNNNGSFANIGDGSNGSGFFVTASVLNKNMGNKDAGYFLLRQKSSGANFEGLVYRLDDPLAEIPGDELQSVYLREIGWGSIRTGWTKGDSLLVFTCSASDLGHNHFDNNSFVMNVNGTWVVNDPGYQDYSPGDNRDYTLYNGHSTIYLDGEAQKMRGEGLIDERMSSSFFTHMVGDSTYNYDGRMRDFARDFIMINHANAPYYIIRDNIVGDGDEHEYTWRLNVTGGTVTEINGKAAPLGEVKKGNSFTVEYGSSAVLNGLFAFDKSIDLKYYSYADKYGLLFDAVKKGDGTSFTALLTAAPCESGANMGGTFFDNAEITGGETNYSEIDSRSLLLYTPSKEGDELSISLVTSRNGKYTLEIEYALLEYGGLYDIYLDDVFVKRIDLLHEGKTVREKLTANVEVTRGEHKLRFVSAGSSKMYVKQYLGLLRTALISEDNGKNYIDILKETDNESLSAMTVSYQNGEDIILFSKNSRFDKDELKEISAHDVSSNGLLASVFGKGAEGKEFTGYAVEYGTSLKYKDTALVTSDAPVNVSMGEDGKLTVISEKDATVTFKVMDTEAEKMAVNGKEASFDGGEYATVKVSQGKTVVSFLSASSEGEGEKEEDTKVDDVTVTPVKDNGYLLIVIIAIAVIAVIAIAAVIIIKRKK